MNAGKWGELIRAEIDKKGDIWVFHRCFNNVPAGNATCVGRDNDPPILKFDRSCKLLTSFGQGIFAFPHGFTVDDEALNITPWLPAKDAVKPAEGDD